MAARAGRCIAFGPFLGILRVRFGTHRLPLRAVRHQSGRHLSASTATADGRLLAHLAAFRIDRLYLGDYHVMWLDQTYPDWRQEFALVSAAPGRAIFSRPSRAR